uniref:Uncharacterized protein n=1 Tax=Cannabis sativa TaxID=3483 RepID=A0A803PT23_CANSA
MPLMINWMQPNRIFTLGYGDLPKKVSKYPMKVLAWNCRGLRNPVAVRQLTMLIVLSETRLAEEKFHRLCLKLHFIEGTYIPPVGMAGGFGLYWRCGFKCKVLSEDKNLINVVIESDPPGTPWN